MEHVIMIVGNHSNTDEIIHLVKQYKLDIQLSFFKIENWNQELSPWSFNEFGDGAAQTLKVLQNQFDLKNSYLVGYSLAGLFCLWASFQCEIKGVGCCSGSLWFENFLDYTKQSCMANKVYLSLGRKEKKTRHPLMSLIQDKTEEAYEILKNQNIPCIFELKNGNHFFATSERMVDAIQWLIQNGSV